MCMYDCTFVPSETSGSKGSTQKKTIKVAPLTGDNVLVSVLFLVFFCLPYQAIIQWLQVLEVLLKYKEIRITLQLKQTVLLWF